MKKCFTCICYIYFIFLFIYSHLILTFISVSQALRENTYPFLAVIVLRDNRMTVVARLEGPTQPEVLIRRLRLIMTDNESSLIAARLERYF